MRAVNADDLIHELDKDGIVEHGYVSVFGIPIIEDCVPVVRCKDCVYGRPYNKVWYQPKKDSFYCLKDEAEKNENWYCADGEKVNENA